MEVVYILVVAVLVALILSCGKEHFGSSDGGALIQLTAKGPQDLYLTGDTEKYWLFPWNYSSTHDEVYDPYFPYDDYYPNYIRGVRE